MADYYATVRTNYFRVTDEKAYQELFDKLFAFEEEVIDLSRTDEDGIVEHAFGGYSTIAFKPDGEKGDNYAIGAFVEQAKELLADGQAICVFEIGYENLRYLVGESVVGVKGKPVFYTNIHDHAQKAARCLLGDPSWTLDAEH